MSENKESFEDWKKVFNKYRAERIKKECPMCSDLWHGFYEGVNHQQKKIDERDAIITELIEDNNKADITIEKYFNKAEKLQAELKKRDRALERCVEKINFIHDRFYVATDRLRFKHIDEFIKEIDNILKGEESGKN